MPVSTLVAHLLALFLVGVAPILAYRRAHEPGAASPGARLRRYRGLVLRQLLIIVAILGWVVAGHIPAAEVGLGPPDSWWIALGGALLIAALLAWSALALRRHAPELREKMRGRGGALLLPETNPEARWFALVSLCGGLAEELGYRGFLFYYARLWWPPVNTLELVLVTSICFGIAHVYQGRRGVAMTSLAGVLMGILYVATGNLLVPAVAHILGNMRAVVIFWTPRHRA